MAGLCEGGNEPPGFLKAIKVGYDDRDWIDLAQDRDRWRAYSVRLRVRPGKRHVLIRRFVRAVVDTLDNQGHQGRHVISCEPDVAVFNTYSAVA
ncbi:hypothetical protein ANN_13333 [Periplaneta americana]|uniref:Uncharacterized protein n=1 Tax=Periplaneta americana TaxID=6978 RepID=A0ABQ8TJ40_PERAM|nr:hypothetical protein ANN_13333 [Periplaneta americana]